MTFWTDKHPPIAQSLAQSLGLGLSLHMIDARLSLGRWTLTGYTDPVLHLQTHALIDTVAGRGRIIGDKFMTTSARQLISNKGYEMYSVSPDTMVYDAIKLMTEAKVGALLVMEDSRLTGIVSERDYTRKIILETRSSRETPVRDIMTSDVLTVTPDQSIEDCMKIMSEYHIRHLPVAENGKPIGVLSVMDVVKNIISEKEFIIEQLELYISG